MSLLAAYRFAIGPMIFWMSLVGARAQAVPNAVENIDFIVTFGAQADRGWGDDDFTQTFFFLVPQASRLPVYIRVFDPDCGGKYDEPKFGWNTRTDFSLYGGAGCYTGPDARRTEPVGDYRSGVLLRHKIFDASPTYDGKWYTFGPLNPLEGELVPEFGGYVFKMVAQGLQGDDGNLYRYFLSSEPKLNVAVEGGNAFTYEYAFRLKGGTSGKVGKRAKGAEGGSITHLYPFVNDRVVSIKQSNFDADGDAALVVFSVAKNGQPAAVSGDKQWRSSVLPIVKEEHGLSLDLRLRNRSKASNDMVFYVTDQYDTALPFFAVPLGGPPKYRYAVDVKVRH